MSPFATGEGDDQHLVALGAYFAVVAAPFGRFVVGVACTAISRSPDGRSRSVTLPSPSATCLGSMVVLTRD